MISKKYKIPVYREVCSSELIKTGVTDSHFKLDVIKNERVLEVNEDFESIVYNVERDRDKLIIYSNTLNLKITDKFFNNIPLYEFVTFYNEEDYLNFIKDKKEYVVEKNPEDIVVYFNSNKDDFVIGKQFLYNVGNPLNRSSTVKTRKLKNRFKITITNINSQIASVLVGSRYIFSPSVYRNFLEFYESIATIGNTQYYFYNHSFNGLNKIEVKVDKPKDPVIEYLDYYFYKDYKDYNVYKYTSWRSNLLFDQKIPTDFYYYLKLHPENKTDLILQSYSKIDDPSLLFICSSKVTNKDYKMTINPYLETDVVTPVGENFSLIFDENKDKKYNHYNDIKFGTERLTLDLEKLIKNTTNYISILDKDIYQEDNALPITYESYKSTLDLPDYLLNNLISFRERVQTILSNEDTTNIKIYKSN